jgi:transcriptional regulator with XRE-family HTH domain
MRGRLSSPLVGTGVSRTVSASTRTARSQPPAETTRKTAGSARSATRSDALREAATPSKRSEPMSQARRTSRERAPEDADLRAASSAETQQGIEEVVSSIGPKVHGLRMQKGLSLQQLADRSEVSAAAIHKVERSGMVPTIATLMKIAAALNRPVSYFTEEEEAEADARVVFTPGSGRRRVFTSKSGIELRGISGPYGKFFVAAASAVIQPRASSGAKPMTHPGEELIYLLKGSLQLEVDGTTFRLRPGDSLHFKADRPHRWRNPGSTPAEALWTTLRPVWMEAG